MTNVRLTPSQKEELERCRRLLERVEGHSLTQGEAIAHLARLFHAHRDPMARHAEEPAVDLRNDPMVDRALVFDIGRPTDARKTDRVLYRGR